jgi:hypothetical protein
MSLLVVVLFQKDLLRKLLGELKEKYAKENRKYYLKFRFL